MVQVVQIKHESVEESVSFDEVDGVLDLCSRDSTRSSNHSFAAALRDALSPPPSASRIQRRWSARAHGLKLVDALAAKLSTLPMGSNLRKEEFNSSVAR